MDQIKKVQLSRLKNGIEKFLEVWTVLNLNNFTLVSPVRSLSFNVLLLSSISMGWDGYSEGNRKQTIIFLKLVFSTSIRTIAGTVVTT